MQAACPERKTQRERRERARARKREEREREERERARARERELLTRNLPGCGGLCSTCPTRACLGALCNSYSIPWVNFTATQRTVALCIGRFVLTPIMVLRNSLTCSIMFRDVLLNMVLEPEGGDYLRQLAVSVLI
jgi:hypothetical protein